jgi:hypothetical protein
MGRSESQNVSAVLDEPRLEVRMLNPLTLRDE